MSDEYDATAAWEAIPNFGELMKLRYISDKAIKVFNSMAFVVLYHHQSVRDEFKYHGDFSNNLKIVYVEDDPMFINKIFGLYIIGYWFEHDTNLECQEIIKQRMLLVINGLVALKRENE